MSRRPRRPFYQQPMCPDEYAHDVYGYPRDTYLSPFIPVPIFPNGHSPLYTYGMPEHAASTPANMTGAMRFPERPMVRNARHSDPRPARSTDKPPPDGDEDLHLRIALRDFHQEVGKASAYFNKQLDEFETRMQGIQRFADDTTQHSIWKKWVISEHQGLWEFYAKAITGKMERINTEVKNAYFDHDNFLWERIQSLSESLKACSADISRLTKDAKHSTADCQKLVDTLYRAHELSDPDCKRTSSWLDRVSNCRPHGDKTQETDAEEPQDWASEGEVWNEDNEAEGHDEGDA